MEKFCPFCLKDFSQPFEGTLMNRFVLTIHGIIFICCTCLMPMLFSEDKAPVYKSPQEMFDEGMTYEEWWQKALGNTVSLQQFAEWLGNEQSLSRVIVRTYLKNKKYESILDVPCGLCIDYFGLMIDKIPIRYTGLDVTPQLVKNSQERGIPAMEGSIEDIPFKNSYFDIGYARHILEHLPSYEKAVDELIRVSIKEVLVVFFVKPSAEIEKDDTHLNICDGYPAYHNCYARKKLEDYILANPKVYSIEWREVNEKEEILHIYLNRYLK